MEDKRAFTSGKVIGSSNRLKTKKMDPFLLRTKQVMMESMQRLSENSNEDAISVMSARDIL